jgi:Periplasmic copper-binding protein (NosD)
MLLCCVGAFLVSGGAARPANGPLVVTYTGERGGFGTALDLQASAGTRGARIVAVTFLLDGRPLVSSTVPPYARSIRIETLPSGRHRLSVAAVDSDGRRARSRPVVVAITQKRPTEVRVSPTHGLASGLAALARGRAVRFAPGRYVVSDVRLGSGAQLIGSGSQTVLAAPGGSAYRSIVIAAGQHISVERVTLDGGGPGGGSGNAVEVTSGSSDVLLRHVRAVNVRNVGVFAWGAYAAVSLQDSLLDGGGKAEAGFVAGESGSFGDSRDSSIIRTRVRGFTRWGVLFAHQAHGNPNAAKHAVALDNVVTDIRGSSRPPGTAEGGIWSGSAEGAIIGNTVARAGWDGIETVGSSERAVVVGNRVTATRTGIYIEHSTNDSVIARNHVSRVESGITVEWSYGGVASRRNTFVGNRIVDATRIGMIISIGADQNRIVGNRFIRGARPIIILQGSSANLVRANEGCGSQGVLVVEQAAPDEHGAPAVPSRNVIAANRQLTSCAGR